MALRRVLSLTLVLAVALCAPSFLSAQDTAPKIDVFGGYSWYHAGGTVDGIRVPDYKKGWGGQFTYNVTNWVGIAVDGAGHYNDFGTAHTIAVGPQFKMRVEHVTPFGEALIGVQLFDPKHFANQSATVFMVGGGLEYPVNSRFAIRPFQIDYVNSYYDKLTAPGQTNTFNGVRLQGGLVFSFGVPPKEGTVSATCAADPQAVDMGAPVKVTVTPSGFLPKRTLSYSYTSTGGKIAGTANTATVDTSGLAPGSYTVGAKIIDDGKGKHQQSASCQAAFSINEPPKHPPVLSISANPTTVTAGDTVTITASGSSPDNRPLSYNCTTTGGRLTGNGPTYTLDTAGVPEGSLSVHCTVSDDRNLTASSDASVQVNVPPPPPTAKDFGSIEFKNDLKRPTRVDNEAKGELDRYADALAAAPDAKGVVVGYATAKENAPAKGRKGDFAAQRAVNTKDYLTKEKGIDAGRIEPRTGTGDDQKTELWIVPTGATFPSEGTSVIDQTKVKAVPRTAPAPKMVPHKKAAKPKP